MMELEETSEILRSATRSSLVTIDELGRGTSTWDGCAVALATAEYLVSTIKPFCMFVTHYPTVNELAGQFSPAGLVKAFHMAFVEHESDIDHVKTVSFLYRLTEGACRQSYGLNVALMAEIPRVVVELAARKSNQLKTERDFKQRSLLHALFEELMDLLSGQADTMDLAMVQELQSRMNMIQDGLF
jgi:DNA mismatch repair ATPase MutS